MILYLYLYLKTKFLFGKLFSAFVLFYICLRINRYSEFGNDAMSHMTVFYLISKFIYWDLEKVDNYKKLLLLSVFSFLNKPFLVFVFIFPAYVFLKKIRSINYNFIINIPTLFLSLWLIKNILISGCAVYPIEQTCFKNLTWTDIKEASNQRIMGEAWAKAWPQRDDKTTSYQTFVKNFNWLEAWKKEHQKIFIKNLLPFLMFVIFFVLFFRGKENNIKTFNREKKNLILIFSVLGSIYFFLKFPLYRYGYSYLIILINLILLFNLNINSKKLNKYIKPMIIICSLALLTKHGIMSYKYYETRPIIPNDRYLPDKYKKRVKEIKLSSDFKYFKSATECRYFKAPCTHKVLDTINHKKIFNYDIVFK